MTDIERRHAATKFAEDWKDRGDDIEINIKLSIVLT